jgi:hypothetical protein
MGKRQWFLDCSKMWGSRTMRQKQQLNHVYTNLSEINVYICQSMMYMCLFAIK